MTASEVGIAGERRRGQLWKRVKGCWQLYLILLIPLCSVLLFAYQPMYGVQIAFRNYNAAAGIARSPWVGLRHFVTFFKSYYFGRVVSNTLRISLISLLAGPPLAAVFALMLNTVRSYRLKKYIQTVTYVPHFISVVVLVGMINLFLSPATGIYGGIYRLLHEGQLPQAITGKAQTFVPIYILSGIWASLGWSSIIYLAALSNVNPELHEAAMIDGASRLGRIRHIDFPAILPTVSIMLILAFGGIMSVGFDKAYLMQTDMNLSRSEVISTYVYKVGIMGGITGFSYGSAIGLFNSIINFVLLVAVNFTSRTLNPDRTSLF
jgi:putative aldouronate transport system permease protein